VVCRRTAGNAAVAALVVTAGFAVVWVLALPWLAANLVLLGLPLAYGWARSRQARPRVRAKFTMLLVAFGVFVFEYLCERYGAWSGTTALPFRFPGGVSLEEITWIALFVPLVLLTNEQLHGRRPLARPRPFARPLLKAGFYVGLVFVLVPALHAPLATHTYLKVGLVLQLPVIAAAVAIDRGVVGELLVTGLLAGSYNLAFEVLALRHGYWNFPGGPGSYVGWVTILGARFPAEELLCMVVLGAPSIVATYAIYKNYKRIGDRPPDPATPPATEDHRNVGREASIVGRDRALRPGPVTRQPPAADADRQHAHQVGEQHPGARR
jgi:hypothetical protein